MPTDLFDEHRAILAVADEIVAAAKKGRQVGMAELGRKRTRFASMLMAHLATEQREIHMPLRAMGGLAALGAAPETVAACRDLQQRYSAHVNKWTPAAIELDWAGYATASSALNARMKHVFALEEAELYRPALTLLAAGAQTARA